MRTRYLFVVGGVMSGIGKGVTAAAIARILKDRGLSVAPVKIDPYINVDAGTMNPLEHGEVFVTEDGMECDQDLGNYERFLDEAVSGAQSITTGQIYRAVITRERNLGYGGRCVEAVPDIPNEVIARLKGVARVKRADIVLVEIGGTIGEYQNILYLEAARLMRRRFPRHVAVALVSYLPVPYAVGEMKTKPTQQAVRMLQETGIQPDFIIARGPAPLDAPRKRKLSLFCNVSEEHIISAPDITNIYEVPRNFERERLGDRLVAALGISGKRHPRPPGGLTPAWRALLERSAEAKTPLRIGIVGKYFATGTFVLRDAYLSVLEALKHASWAVNRAPELCWIDAEEIDGSARRLEELKAFHGIVVPGGFGSRGTEGKIRAIRFARERRIPFLGLCFGLQLAVVEFTRNVCDLRRAHTTEINPKTPHPVVHLLSEQRGRIARSDFGGTMRLGAMPCAIAAGTLAAHAYAKGKRPLDRARGKGAVVRERHRHRYEVNNDYRDRLIAKGLIVSGLEPKRNLVEIIELPTRLHPFFLATQFHPEFQSTPLRPHPLFLAFMETAKRRRPDR